MKGGGEIELESHEEGQSKGKNLTKKKTSGADQRGRGRLLSKLAP